jgi:murein DD-endopeptidase MepM/ murein hydrolase activator NlpD
MYGGKVVEVGTSSSRGNYIIIEAVVDGQIIQFSYSHMDEPSNIKLTKNSDGSFNPVSIDAGDKVGVMGTTGSGSTGSHLHLEVTINDVRVNPDPNYKGPGRSGYDPADGTGYIPVPYGW